MTKYNTRLISIAIIRVTFSEYLVGPPTGLSIKDVIKNSSELNSRNHYAYYCILYFTILEPGTQKKWIISHNYVM